MSGPVPPNVAILFRSPPCKRDGSKFYTSANRRFAALATLRDPGAQVEAILQASASPWTVLIQSHVVRRCAQEVMAITMEPLA